MKKAIFSSCAIVFALSSLSASCNKGNCGTCPGNPTWTPKNDITNQIPFYEEPINENFEKIDNVAQYKNADWSDVLFIKKNISRREAMQIAEDTPEVTFFFYTKGGQMVLETKNGDYRRFGHGDAVFFKGEPWWGSAKGLADGYVKTR